MGVYKCEIVKTLDDLTNPAQWRNVYHLNTPTISDAADISDNVLSVEAAIHGTTVKFVKTIISDPTKVERRIIKSWDSTSGDRTITGAVIPDWNVADVEFIPASNHRTERKYYRIQLGEGDIVGAQLESALVTLIQTEMDALVSGVIALCAPNGDSIVNSTAFAAVGMRQLYWKRRHKPGFKRGWVPV